MSALQEALVVLDEDVLRAVLRHAQNSNRGKQLEEVARHFLEGTPLPTSNSGVWVNVIHWINQGNCDALPRPRTSANQGDASPRRCARVARGVAKDLAAPAHVRLKAGQTLASIAVHQYQFWAEKIHGPWAYILHSKARPGSYKWGKTAQTNPMLRIKPQLRDNTLIALVPSPVEVDATMLAALGVTAESEVSEEFRLLPLAMLEIHGTVLRIYEEKLRAEGS